MFFIPKVKQVRLTLTLPLKNVLYNQSYKRLHFGNKIEIASTGIFNKGPVTGYGKLT